MFLMGFNEFVNNMFSSPTKMVIIFGSIIVLCIILVLILLFAGKKETPKADELTSSEGVDTSNITIEPVSSASDTFVNPIKEEIPNIEEQKEEVIVEESPSIAETMDVEKTVTEFNNDAVHVSFAEPIVEQPVAEEKVIEPVVQENNEIDLSNTDRFSFGDLKEYEKEVEEKKDVVYMDEKPAEQQTEKPKFSAFPIPDPEIYQKKDE